MNRLFLLSCLLSLGLLHLAKADDALTNDASILSVYWANEKIDKWSRQAGNDGPMPIANGSLVLSMEGATGGFTRVRRTLTLPDNFVITTRVAIEEFPDTAGEWGNYASYNGIQLLRAYQDDTIIVQVAPSEIRIANWQNKENGTIIPLETKTEKFYTWQFEVSQVEGAKESGTVTIYRREEDEQEWKLIEAGIPLLPADFADDLALAIIYYNTETPDSQGVLQQEYFLVGTAPEPPNR